MAIFEVAMKTHSRKNITAQFHNLNDWVVHHHKPQVFEMVVGRRKETFFTVNCDHEDCGKITSDKMEVEKIWNRWNNKETEIS